MQKPSHITADGSISMVDISAKAPTERFARAQARLRLGDAAKSALQEATLRKGDAFATAQVAGIMAAKQTAMLIPLAHPIPLSSVEVTFSWSASDLIIDASARTTAGTGVEMEAMVAASIAALTIYDMVKSVEKGVSIQSVRLLEKRGGKSGPWLAPA